MNTQLIGLKAVYYFVLFLFYSTQKNIPCFLKRKIQSLKPSITLISLTKKRAMNVESSYQSLLLVLVGAVIGFFSSIGFDLWKEYRAKRELKNRIIEELEIIHKEISADLDGHKTVAREFFTDSFLSLKQELILKLNGKYYRAILETYLKIDELKVPISVGLMQETTEEMYGKRYKEILEKISTTVNLLKG